ncbi:MAG: ribonuclease R [Candidatus Kapabacteria bacterium]|nr:ribonuclease R [Candidatus Kapabacteria bacterium]
MSKSELVEEILKLFRREDKPLQLNQISKQLGIKSETNKYQILKLALAELCRQNILNKSSRRRYSLNTGYGFNTYQGVIEIKDDRGVVTLLESLDINGNDKNGKKKSKGQKIYIKRKDLLTALDGDTVLVRIFAKRDNKKLFGEVADIIKRKERKITGTIEFDGTFYFLIPDEDIYYVDFLVPPAMLNGAKSGDKVAAKFLKWDNPQKSPLAEIIEILGKAGDPKTEYLTILKEFSLPEKFSERILAEAQEKAKNFDKEKNNQDLIKVEDLSSIRKDIINQRLDLRDKLIITIDPADAKDYDDGLSLDFLDNGNFLLGVHIADVSHFVEPNSEMDKEAFKRGNSCYLVDRVVPMLPEEISGNICSLHPNKIRFAFSIFLEISKSGNLKNYFLAESLIKSKKRFSYDEVQDIIKKYYETKQTDKKTTEKSSKEAKLTELVINLHKLASLLRKKRFSKGGINFDTIEVRFVLDENNKPVQAKLNSSNESTQLVEECMLLANKTVAEHIKTLSRKNSLKTKLPFLYRIHDEPNEEKLKSVLDFIKIFIHNGTPMNGSSKAINDFLQKFEGTHEKPIVHQMLIRSMPKAEYSNINIGHFGLGFKEYTHFTSPIRRYPDLVVHRLLKSYIKGDFDRKSILKLERQLEDIGENCSLTEKNAMEAERASVKIAQSVLASEYIGKEFLGTISGVTNFGLFVMLDDLYAEGLVHIRDLYDDYYVFDEKNFSLIGKRRNKTFRFGDRIKVKIIKVNVDKRKIDLIIA